MMMSHPFNATPDTYPGGAGPFPMRRDNNYAHPKCSNAIGPPWPGPANLGWPTNGSHGFAQWHDGATQNLVVIEGQSKWGLVGFWNSGEGDHWYGYREPDNLGAASSGHCFDAKYVLRIYDPDQIGRVVNGSLRSDLLEPTYRYDYHNSPMMAGIYIQNNDGSRATMPFAGPRQGDSIGQQIKGVCWNPTRNRLYVLIDHSYHPGGSGDYATVHVFNVNL
jgi:hypothetical protein